MTGARVSRGPVAATASLIVLAVLATYANSLHGAFVFDDGQSIVANPTIRHLWPLSGALYPPAGGATVSGRPLLNLSLALSFALSGTATWGFHLLNIAIHALAAITLYGILRRHLEESFAALGTLLWALHPLTVESVTYVVQRAESLMGLLYLLTLYCFIRGSEAKRSGGWFFLCGLTCVLGVSVKEAMVTAPVLILLYDRTYVSGSFSAAWHRHRLAHVALAAGWVAAGALAWHGGINRGGTVGFGTSIPWWRWIATQFHSIVTYVRLAAWPHPLNFDYGAHWGRFELAPVLLPAAGVALLAGATALAWRRRPAVGFLGVAFFLLLAVVTLVPLPNETMAEHRMYLPLIPLMVLLTLGLRALGGRPTGLIAGAVIAGAFALLTVRRNEDYRSELALWQDTVTKSPDDPVVHNNLGCAFLGGHRPADAATEFTAALRLDPGLAQPANNLGMALTQLGQMPQAIERYAQAVRADPQFADAQFNLGMALAGQGKFAEAVAPLTAATRLHPADSEAQVYLGAALVNAGRLPEAIDHLQAAVRLDPSSIRARGALDAAIAARAQMQ